MNGDAPISTIMTPAPFEIDAGATLMHAEDRFRQHCVRHLVVTERGEAVGVLSERDVLFARAVEGMDPSRVEVRAAMWPCETYAPTAPIREVVRAMADGRFGACIICVRGRALGIVTTVDVCRAYADALDDAAVRHHPIRRVVATDG
ncbi:MAG: CBS domain-containing protein [Polyangiaceae bacterium]